MSKSHPTLTPLQTPNSEPTETPDLGDSTTDLEPRSKLLQAVLNPDDLTIVRANNWFCELTGVGSVQDLASLGLSLSELFLDFDEERQTQLYRRHLIPLVLRDIYGITGENWRILEEPYITRLQSPLSEEPRYIQFWLRSQHLQVELIDPTSDVVAALDVENPESLSQAVLEEQLNWSNYQIKGELLWEGLDVTSQETIQRLTQLLISPQNSLTDQDTLCQVAEQLRSLFRAETTVLLSWKANQAQIYLCQQQHPEQLPTFTHQTLEESHVLKATAANRVWNVPDLQGTCHTELERELLDRGCQSLLLIPLRQDTSNVDPSQMGNLLGMLILGSDRANNFDQLDASHAEALLPPLRIAFSQATETRFSRVHPAVEWRFLQEAERRSMGLPPEKIIFNDVYPMYGISDIRGSSRERNRAIQEDLLTQFDLALHMVEEALAAKPIAFLEQLQVDLLAYIERLSQEVHVEDEVTAIHYLQQHIEVYFDYFRQCGEGAIAAVENYNEACDPQQNCIYDSRKQYDEIIQQITAQLRTTWEQWQDQMQDILPHYCDMEVSDGIDHMIYIGSSVNSNFSIFHLHSLRYEQLRAICDCARTCFDLRDRANINLEVSHLVLVQNTTVNIFHDEQTERLFDVMGTKDTRYEIVKKRIDKGIDTKEGKRITQPGMLTIVYSSEQEWSEYHQYLRYLVREGWVDSKIESGTVQALQGVTGLKYARVAILPENWEVETEALHED